MSIHHCGANDYINHSEYRTTIISMFNILGFQIGLHKLKFTVRMRHFNGCIVHIIKLILFRELRKSKPQDYSLKTHIPTYFCNLFLRYVIRINKQ